MSESDLERRLFRQIIEEEGTPEASRAFQQAIEREYESQIEEMQGDYARELERHLEGYRRDLRLARALLAMMVPLLVAAVLSILALWVGR